MNYYKYCQKDILFGHYQDKYDEFSIYDKEVIITLFKIQINTWNYSQKIEYYLKSVESNSVNSFLNREINDDSKTNNSAIQRQNAHLLGKEKKVFLLISNIGFNTH